MKKLVLSGISAAPSSTARSKHPTIATEGEMLQLLEQFAQINPQFKTLKNQSETLSKQIGARSKPLYFQHFAGIEPESSTLLTSARNATIKLIIKNSYSKQCTDERLIVAAIGEDKTSRYFRQSTILKFELDKMPEDKQQEFATRAVALAHEIGVEDAVSASQCIQPVAGFHEARTSILTPDENMALDRVIPVTAYPLL